MNLKQWCLLGVVGLLGAGIGWGLSVNLSPRNGITPQTVADYLHAVIEGDRSFYTQHVVERMEAMLIVNASEHWKEKQGLPLPAQFLSWVSKHLAVDEEPFRYRLLSLWPINPQNAPASREERQALEIVVKLGKPFHRQILIHQQTYFQAIYPDRAVSRACVSCHNSHQKSPKRDFKLNDIIGGLEILLPLPASGG